MCKPRQNIELKGVGFQDLACFRNDVGEFLHMELSEKAAFLFSEPYFGQTTQLSTQLTQSAWAQGVMVPMIQ